MTSTSCARTRSKILSYSTRVSPLATKSGQRAPTTAASVSSGAPFSRAKASQSSPIATIRSRVSTW
jgi:hypothetical protein